MFEKLKQVHRLFYVNLLFLLIPLGMALIRGSGIGVLYVVVFIAAYFTTLLSESEWRIKVAWYCMVFMILGGVIKTGSGLIFCTFYLSSLLTYHFVKDKLTSYRWISLIVLLCLVVVYAIYEASVVQQYDNLVFILAVSIGVAGTTLMLRRTAKQELEEQRQLRQHKQINLLLAENERQRIQRDLHDTLGHRFATISLKSELAVKLCERQRYSEAEREIIELNSLIQHSMGEVRKIISDLRVYTIEDELERSSEMLKIAGVRLYTHNQLHHIPLSTVMTSTIGLIILEVANNVVKHAQANRCEMWLQQIEGAIQITVEDDGIGFSSLEGDELHTIRERLEVVQGEVYIEQSAHPTRIVVRIPYGEL